MHIDEYLKVSGKAKADIAKELELSRAAVSKWSEIPEKWLGVLKGGWVIHKDKLYWQKSSFGHGSDWDYNYSAGVIQHVRQLLAQMGSVGAVKDYVSAIDWETGFIQAVKDDVVCPNVVVMEPIEGQRSIPVRVFPFGPRLDES